MGQWTGPVSEPVLFAGSRIVRGSCKSARYGSQCAADARLGDLTRLATWNDLSERALEEGRTRVVRSVLRNSQALEDAVSAIFPAALAKPLRFVAGDAAARLDRKYSPSGRARLAAHRTPPYARQAATAGARGAALLPIALWVEAGASAGEQSVVRARRAGSDTLRRCSAWRSLACCCRVSCSGRCRSPRPRSTA